MTIFNSLGSNYSPVFVWHSLFSYGSSKRTERARKLLAEHYGGEVTLTYKGREALELALRRSGLPTGSAVAINGYTCYVVYQAVEQAGYRPVFVDVAENHLHFGVGELQKVHENNSDLRALIVQNTLGYPADMPALATYAREHQLMIIEDLAHSTGATYHDGQEAGKIGELVMLSFSQDKPVDIVAGGALIDRRPQPKTGDFSASYVGPLQRFRVSTYPLWTLLIRVTYGIGIGRYIHALLKKLRLLATPMSDEIQGLHRMQKSRASLLVRRWQDLAAELAHRRKIAAIYAENLPLQWQISAEGNPSFLRFPITVNDRAALVNYLRRQHIYIGDTWYDAPIAPASYLARTDYQSGECPRAENWAEHIVNLPTHRHVTPEVARTICAKIKQWQTPSKK